MTVTASEPEIAAALAYEELHVPALFKQWAPRVAEAKRLAPAIDWREGTAESLPYETETFDAVVGQFGLMFFQDRPAADRNYSH